MTTQLPELPKGFNYELGLRHHVTPHLLKGEPVHNWYYFPHSFSPQLVDYITNEYKLSTGSTIIDPFMGAGTTLLRAKQLGFSSVGCDLSPLSVLVTKAKLIDYDSQALTRATETLINTSMTARTKRRYPERLKKAFTDKERDKFSTLQEKIGNLDKQLQPFFRLALLIVQQMLSRAIPDGGWFRWIEKSDASDQIISLYHQQVLSMLGSLEQVPHKVERNNVWRAIEKDARQLDILKGKFDALITSPPYPNRHDYSRIFHIELLSIGLSERKITRLRHNSIRSHVEARAYYSSVFDYQKPAILDTCLQSLPEDADTRIAPMLAGYFEDMYICLKAAHRILKPGAPCALVVGNVRHAGIMIPVDEIMIEIGEQVGFTLSKAHVARMRGNSAQQMAKFGRQPARETIVILLS